MTERLVSGRVKEEDVSLDVSLRPRRLEEFVGQGRVKENLAPGSHPAVRPAGTG